MPSPTAARWPGLRPRWLPALPALLLCCAAGAADERQAAAREIVCSVPKLVSRATLPVLATAELCQEYCKQTPACVVYRFEGFRWDADASWQWRAGQATAALDEEGPPLQRRLVDAGLDLAHSPEFGDCPVGGAAIRLLQVWATASYHHGLVPAVAFATEAPELSFRPELSLALSVDWHALLASAWAGVFFGAMARLARGLCPRLAAHGDATCGRQQLEGCDLAAASAALAQGGSPEALKRARRAAQGCAPGGRLSELLRARGAAELLSRLAALAPKPPTAAVPPEDHESDAGVDSVDPRSLGAVAVREEVIAETLATIGLSASLRRRSGKRPDAVDALVFVERLRPSGHVSGFFDQVTENRCEMDMHAHFHRVFCVLSPADALPEFEPALVAASMVSGLLVHPPYGPAAWSCGLPTSGRVDAGHALTVELLDPSLWDVPLLLDVRPLPRAPPRVAFAACPQPLYRLEAHPGLLRDWIAYHKRLGVQHWTIYDLDGSAEQVLKAEPDVDLVSRFPDALASPRLKAGNAWNPICLEAIAQTRCFWEYRGRARWVLSLHSFDEYLVSPRHRERALSRFAEAVLEAREHRRLAVVRIPAVNYAGVAETDVGSDAPVLQWFLRHDGRLYWHIVIADPSAVLSVNTTNARASRPGRHLQYWEPEDLRVNHYIDALGARSPLVDRFKHRDAPEAISRWAGELLAGLRSERAATLAAWTTGVTLPLLVLGHRAAMQATPGAPPPRDLALAAAAGQALSPALRAALGAASAAEAEAVGEALRAAFAAADADSSGGLSRHELRDFAAPTTWGGHLRRRDLHALGLYLHVWLAEDSDWEAAGLFQKLDSATLDGAVSASEWSSGLLRVLLLREARAALSALERQLAGNGGGHLAPSLAIGRLPEGRRSPAEAAARRAVGGGGGRAEGRRGAV